MSFKKEWVQCNGKNNCNTLVYTRYPRGYCKRCFLQEIKDVESGIKEMEKMNEKSDKDFLKYLLKSVRNHN